MTDREELAQLRQELADTQETLRLCIEALESVRERVGALEQQQKRTGARWRYAGRRL